MILRVLLLVLVCLVAAVAALILLLTVFPLRFTFEYKEPGLLVQLRAGPLRFTLLRRETPEQKAERARKKAEKEAKKKKKPKPPPDPEEQKRRRKGVPRLVKKILEEFSRKGKIPLERLWLDVTFGGDDPASAAMLFGGAHAALGALWPVVERYFEVGDRRFRTAVDFNLPATRVDYFCAVLPLPLAKALTVGVRVLVWLVRERKSAGAPEGAGEKPHTPTEQKEAV